MENKEYQNLYKLYKQKYLNLKAKSIKPTDSYVTAPKPTYYQFNNLICASQLHDSWLAHPTIIKNTFPRYQLVIEFVDKNTETPTALAFQPSIKHNYEIEPEFDMYNLAFIIQGSLSRKSIYLSLINMVGFEKIGGHSNGSEIILYQVLETELEKKVIRQYTIGVDNKGEDSVFLFECFKDLITLCDNSRKVHFTPVS